MGEPAKKVEADKAPKSDNDNSAMSAERRVLMELAVAGKLAWYTTEEAGWFLKKSPNAVLKAIERGDLTPDIWGTKVGDKKTERRRVRGHRFKHSTLQAYWDWLHAQ